MAGKLSKFFETLKDHLNPQRNPKLFNFLKRISNFFKKRTRAIVHNKNDWMERIQRGNEFAVHEDD